MNMLRHPDSNRDGLIASFNMATLNLPPLPIPVACTDWATCLPNSTMSQCFPTSTWTGLFTSKKYDS